MTTTIGILQPSYLPWLGYFEQIARSDVFVLYDDVQFEKGSWRNRNRIKTPKGPMWLTVPVLTKGRGPQSIYSVQINNAQPWGQKHLRSIVQHYARAPHFQAYSGQLLALIGGVWDSLCDLNIALIRHLAQALGITTRFVLASELDAPGSGTSRLVDIVERLGGSVLYEGAAGRQYIEEDLFAARGLRIEYQDYQHPRYEQLHGEFLPYLSVVDLLFNHGPDSLAILTGGTPS